MLSLDADVLRVAQKVREVGRALDERYLDKSELVRMLLVPLVAGEHMLIVGPPGTAKSAMVRHLSRLIDARYFEYLLTRFSEPNEIFGPIDIKAFREGTYTRKTETMLASLALYPESSELTTVSVTLASYLWRGLGVMVRATPVVEGLQLPVLRTFGGALFATW